MLVISRRKGQRVTIGDEIELVVTEVHRSHVKLGIKAPRGFTVLRGEVHDSIESANRAAAESYIDEDFALRLTPPTEETVKPADQLLAQRQQDGAPTRTASPKNDGPEIIVRRRRASDRTEEPASDEVRRA